VPHYDSYECSTYRNGRKRQLNRCSIHHTNSEAVRELILDTIRRVSAFARENETEFIDRIREATIIRHTEAAATHKTQIERNEKRITELDMLFRKVYEDNALGKLTDDRFRLLSDTYDNEQAILKEQTANLRAELDVFDADSVKADKFIEIVRRYSAFEELTTPMLNELVEKVLVYNPDKSTGERVQRIDIYLTFIGKFEMPAANEERQSQEADEAEEKRLARKRQQSEYFRKRYAEKKNERKREEEKRKPKIA
jgi:hypothetical protein